MATPLNCIFYPQKNYTILQRTLHFSTQNRVVGVLISLGYTIILFFYSYYTPIFKEKGGIRPPNQASFKKNDVLFCFNSKYTAKFADICNELQKPQKFVVFFCG